MFPEVWGFICIYFSLQALCFFFYFSNKIVLFSLVAKIALGFCGKYGFISITDTLKYNLRVSKTLNPILVSLWV